MEKSALQLLKEDIEYARHMCDDPRNEMDIFHTLDVLIQKATELLPTEREQIEQAYSEGHSDCSEGVSAYGGELHIPKCTHDYYTTHFN